MNDAWTRLPWQTHLWSVLRPQDRSSGHHALLIHGPTGIGKERLARALLASLLCDRPQTDASACGDCPSCAWLVAGNHPDFRILTTPSRRVDALDEEKAGETPDKKAAEEIGINEIRALASFLAVTTHRGGLRVVLICPADALNTAAANALLKTLEEPIPGTRFILVTDQAQRLPATIKSRCMPITIPLPPHREALHWLRERGVQDAELLLDRYAGRPLAAASAAESLFEDEEAFIQSLMSLKTSPFALSEKASKETLGQWVDWLQCWCHDLLLVGATGEVRFFLNHEARLKALAKTLDLGALVDWEAKLRRAARLATEPMNPKLMMDELLLGYVELLKHSPDT